MGGGVLGAGLGAVRHVLFGGFFFDGLFELLEDVVFFELGVGGHAPEYLNIGAIQIRIVIYCSIIRSQK